MLRHTFVLKETYFTEGVTVILTVNIEISGSDLKVLSLAKFSFT